MVYAAEYIAGYPFHGRKIIIHHNNLPNPLFILCICLPSFIYSLHLSATPYLFSASVFLNPLLHPGKRIPNHFIPAVFVKSPWTITSAAFGFSGTSRFKYSLVISPVYTIFSGFASGNLKLVCFYTRVKPNARKQRLLRKNPRSP